MTHEDRLKFLEIFCGKMYIKQISTGEWRLWLGSFNENAYIPMSSIVGYHTYFTTECATEFDVVQEAYWKLHDAVMNRCCVSVWDRQ
jgi:hypothetical protein